ncbi:fimbrillin family protein [Hallella absiana]|nr:fimbrillin family protein [Hallella absiana]
MRKEIYKIGVGILSVMMFAACGSESADNGGGVSPDRSVLMRFGALSDTMKILNHRPTNAGTKSRFAETRAATQYYANKKTGIPAGQAMGVFGYQYPYGQDWAVTDTANFMYNRRMVSGGRNAYGHTTFSYSPLAYWPQENTYRLAFFAYYPYEATPTTAGSSTTASTTGIVPTVAPGTGMGTFAFTTQDKSSEQVDFMMSDLRTNLTHATNLSGSASSDTVSLPMHHLLSQVAFHVDTSTVPLGYTSFHVKSITMRHVAKRGTMRPTYSSGATSFAWTLEPATDNDSVTVDNIEDDATEAVPCCLLLLPQDNSAISLRVEVTAVPVGGEHAIVGNATMLMSGTGVSGNWQRGQAYYYTLRLKELTKENRLYIYITPGAPDDPDQSEDYTGGSAIEWGGTWNGGDIDAAKPAVRPAVPSRVSPAI